MTKKEIAAKLREALRLMNDNGAHWVKGEYSETIEWDEDDEPVEVGYCSLGAIRQVMDAPLWDGDPASNEIAYALAEVLPPLPRTYAVQSEDSIAFDKIVTWNDNDDRTWEQVVEKFNEAAERAEASA